jgi:hypothetical protein
MKLVSESVAGGDMTHLIPVWPLEQESMGGKRHPTHAVTYQPAVPHRPRADEEAALEEVPTPFQACVCNHLHGFVLLLEAVLAMVPESHIRGWSVGRGLYQWCRGLICEGYRRRCPWMDVASALGQGRGLQPPWQDHDRKLVV